MGILRLPLWFGAMFVVALLGGSVRAAEVSPATVALDRPEASQQLLIRQREGDRSVDFTRAATYEVAEPKIVRVDANGLVEPIAEGSTTITARVNNEALQIPVTVTGLVSPPPVSFENEIQAILTKSSCNSGGCHGKAEGQNGFKLSLLGFDHAFDHTSLTIHARGRRISLAAPETSLLLRKATAFSPHGGGQKIEPDSPAYRRMLRWIASGAPAKIETDHPVVTIEVEPARLVMRAGETHALQVWAKDAQGKRRCVTVETDFASNAPHVVAASARGLLTASDIPGESAILVRHLGHVAVCRVIVPRPDQKFARPPENNFVDQHVWNKLTELGIPPSDLCDDATFLRRVALDVTGTLPTADEARAFLTDTSPDKRAKLVDRLLERPEYATYWAMKWTDILRADKIKITTQGTVGMSRWLRKQFAANRPYDAMVRDVLTAQGPVQSESPVGFFKAVDQPEVAGRAVSQLFLGVRIECAQCHHHPSERWGQDDYAGFAGFFTGVKVKRLPDGTESIVSRGGTDVNHPRTGKPVAARALGAGDATFALPTNDRRTSLATWATAADNPFFARAIANRLWAHYFGRGIVEPIDDLRATNPPTNEPLMSALEAHMRDVKFDLKAFTRTLLNSRAYQLSSQTIEGNRDDRQNFSHAAAKAMPAEVLLDAVCQTTGVPEKFNGWPLGVRSIEVWDNRIPSYFFRIFGRPARATVCECERSNEPSISQALHLINSPEIHAKIGDRHGWVRNLAATDKKPEELIDEVYLSALSRFPKPEEKTTLLEAFADPTTERHEALEDVLWSVLNTKEFLYTH